MIEQDDDGQARRQPIELSSTRKNIQSPTSTDYLEAVGVHKGLTTKSTVEVMFIQVAVKLSLSRPITLQILVTSRVETRQANRF